MVFFIELTISNTNVVRKGNQHLLIFGIKKATRMPLYKLCWFRRKLTLKTLLKTLRSLRLKTELYIISGRC